MTWFRRASSHRGPASRGREVAINHYEGMFILDSARFGADPDKAAAEVSAIIEKVGGTVVAHRPWQDAKLAYEINGHRKGLYYLTFFTAESTSVNGIKGIVKLNDNVIRHLIINHPKVLFDRMVDMIGGAGPEQSEQVDDSDDSSTDDDDNSSDDE